MSKRGPNEKRKEFNEWANSTEMSSRGDFVYSVEGEHVRIDGELSRSELWEIYNKMVELRMGGWKE